MSEINVKLSEGRSVVVQRKKWNGKEYVDVRTYITSQNYTGYTKKGVMIPVDKAREVGEAILKVTKQ